MYRVASSVLGVRADLVDIRSSHRAVVGGVECTAHFDNCSHSSGRQRCYIACKVRHHSACFRYATLDQFPNSEHAIAWLIAWKVKAIEAPDTFTKADHKKHQPTEADVGRYKGLAQELP